MNQIKDVAWDVSLGQSVESEAVAEETSSSWKIVVIHFGKLVGFFNLYM